MNLDDLILVSVDDHAIEPPDAFKHHMPEKFKGREPHVEKRGDRDVWIFEDEATGYMGLNSVVGRPKEEYGMEPLGYDQMRRGTWDVAARVDDMNANGVLLASAFRPTPIARSLWLLSALITTGTYTTGATPRLVVSSR